MRSDHSACHAQIRQHRRQNSTPSGFEGANVPNRLPRNVRQAAQGHRRGLSLDIRGHHNMASPATRQAYVSTNTNNAGLVNYTQEQFRARAGSHQNPYTNLTAAANASESYLTSQQAQSFEPFDPSSMSFQSYNPELDALLGRGQAAYADNMSAGKGFDVFDNSSAFSTPTFANFAESPSAPGWVSEGDTSSTRRNSRRMSNDLMDRADRFDLNVDGLPRPMTPPNQNLQSQSLGWAMPLRNEADMEEGYLPPTPIETPQDPTVKDEPRPNRFANGYDESMEETVKPVRNRGGNPRVQNIFQDIRQQSEQTPSRSAQPNPISGADSFSIPLNSRDLMSMSNFNDEFLKIEASFDRDAPNGLPVDQQFPQRTTPNTPQTTHFMPFDNTSLDNKPDLRPYPLNAHTLSAIPMQTPSRRQSPHHRRTDSVASQASAASIASINIEDTKTETGVSQEEISQHISGPDAKNGRWYCLFEGCGKDFGRKENIKSHVQTHLNDRQYQCPTCKKCFVRQHDLKRHAKIHTGIKPYPCECGNTFARHDALTRHRQRGMCIGAFDGIVRKSAKRGRPPKNRRPDMEARIEKSTRTRKKNMSISSTSSFSAYSDSSVVNSPENDLDMLDDAMMDIGMGSQTQTLAHMSSASMSSAPMSSLPTATMNVNDYASSPSAVSAHSYVSPEALMENTPPNNYVSPGEVMESTPANGGSPAKSNASRSNTPPALSQSSSPPLQSQGFFDVDNTLNTDDLSTLSGTSTLMTSAAMADTLPLVMSEQDHDALLQFSNDDNDCVSLYRDPEMLMMSKLEEDLDNNDLFMNNGDDFFGTS
ncbi:hypothetical protein NCS57_00558200 [Fusarium keratoplasticum]|uniref:Uncharacterized protein n=1 Tax=Fusarium keratoplasticum TaxID=1328300 RepID=A0ACC0R248_9HYPO|nr:hypothetical protein NCS57_00558200 [Fusarium keratoplasticum]KAI8670851.1 hypothetical protein NCS57_00558200 [Fusarium keratoplasticum]KAI8678085.1 hypothetical protein NCS55_00527800 [Fusarium keratoplasticum]